MHFLFECRRYWLSIIHSPKGVQVSGSLQPEGFGDSGAEAPEFVFGGIFEIFQLIFILYWFE